MRLDVIDILINKTNKKGGFTPLIELSLRGYHVIGEADKAAESRWRIAEVLLENGAEPNFF